MHEEKPKGFTALGQFILQRQNVRTLLFVEQVLKSRSSQINDSIKSLFFWGKYLCLHLFKVVVYCSIPVNIHDVDLLLEGKKEEEEEEEEEEEALSA